MIYRIAEMADWEMARQHGVFISADLAREGFIHCSGIEQVLRTARKYYADRKELILLEIDALAIGSILRVEDLTGKGEKFPHVYGPIPLAAVVRHFAFSTDKDGDFSLPREL